MHIQALSVLASSHSINPSQPQTPRAPTFTLPPASNSRNRRPRLKLLPTPIIHARPHPHINKTIPTTPPPTLTLHRPFRTRDSRNAPPGIQHTPPINRHIPTLPNLQRHRIAPPTAIRIPSHNILLTFTPPQPRPIALPPLPTLPPIPSFPPIFIAIPIRLIDPTSQHTRLHFTRRAQARAAYTGVCGCDGCGFRARPVPARGDAVEGAELEEATHQRPAHRHVGDVDGGRGFANVPEGPHWGEGLGERVVFVEDRAENL